LCPSPQSPRLADAAFIEHNIEFGFTEGRGNLVLLDGDLRAIAHDFPCLFDGLDAPNV
jgi:hypothetical protein